MAIQVKGLSESDLVRIRGALEEETLIKAIQAVERVLKELGYRRVKG